jgi:demethylspheroidene O-methyltransferase
MPAGRWRDRWIAWRNHRLGDPGFQRWAADFPLTAWIARRRARDLFDLVAGFVYSQALVACLELELLDRLRASPEDTATLAAATELSEPALTRLLTACAALGLVERAGTARWALGPRGATLLGAAGLGRMVLHHGPLYADLADPVGLLRQGGGRLADYWSYAPSAAPEATGPYSALMTATQPAVASDLLAAYKFARHRRLLDVGGGEGAFLAAVGARAPGLGLMLFDLPSVARAARRRLGAASLLERTEIVEGDFLRDPLPTGADLITLVRILHDHDDDDVDRLLRSARKALPDDGALLIGEPMSSKGAPDRVGDVYFAFYLLAMGRGRARTPGELIARLHAAGFRRARILPTRTPFLLSAILAQP